MVFLEIVNTNKKDDGVVGSRIKMDLNLCLHLLLAYRPSRQYALEHMARVEIETPAVKLGISPEFMENFDKSSTLMNMKGADDKIAVTEGGESRTKAKNISI